jgi:hypothetical protein
MYFLRSSYMQPCGGKLETAQRLKGRVLRK